MASKTQPPDVPWQSFETSSWLDSGWLLQPGRFRRRRGKRRIERTKHAMDLHVAADSCIAHILLDDVLILDYGEPEQLVTIGCEGA